MSNIVKFQKKEQTCHGCDLEEITEFFANKRKRIRKERQTVNTWALVIGFAIITGWMVGTLAAQI